MAIKHTLRFLVVEERRKDFDLRFLVTKILLEKCGMQLTEIYCIQDFQASGTFDVTFVEDADCRKCFNKIRAIGTDPEFKGIKIMALFYSPVKVLTVHCFNPFVDVNLIEAFLSRYCEYVKGGTKLRNEFGIYNGKMTFEVKLKMDLNGYGGVLHPPSNFNIAGQRGFLSYAGQPKYCKKCFKYGHFQKECPNEKACRHCGRTGHEAKSCPEPKCCDVCGVNGHVVKNCPQYKKADAAGGKEGPKTKVFGQSMPEKGASGMKPEETKNKPETEETGKNVGEKSQVHSSGGSEAGASSGQSQSEREVKMDTSEKRTWRFRIIDGRYFRKKIRGPEIREMGFVQFANTDAWIVPRGFIPPKDWTDFDEKCEFR